MLQKWMMCVCALVCCNTLCGALRIDNRCEAKGFYEHTFEYTEERHPEEIANVVVVGEFNAMSSRATPLQEVSPGVYQTNVCLPEGEYKYTYRVHYKDGSFQDKPDIYTITYDSGHPESKLNVGPPANFGYGDQTNHLANIRTDLLALQFEVLHNRDNIRFLSFVSPSLLRVLFRIPHNASPLVEMQYKAEGQEEWKKQRMDFALTLQGWDYYALTLDDVQEGEIAYSFSLFDGILSLHVGANGFSSHDQSPQPYRATIGPNPQYPDWGVDRIWYQILLDRFRDGLEKGHETQEWNVWPSESQLFEIQSKHIEMENRKLKINTEFRQATSAYNQWINELSYGGDFQGLKQKMGYLQQLGVNAIYLNPIFKGQGVHRYHTMDMRHVDDAFGIQGSYDRLEQESDDPETWKWSETDLLFLDWVQVAHDKGFKVVLDVNLHSVYKKSPWFLDVLERGKESPYYEWFEIYDSGAQMQYLSWDAIYDNDEMPSFAATSHLNYPESLKRYLFGVLLRWMAPDGDASRGVDGFRIDSPDSLPVHFVHDLHQFIKMHKPQALLIGEKWEGSHRGNRLNAFDGIQDVGWTGALYEAFVGVEKNIGKYAAALEQRFRANSIVSVLSSWNALDNHDTMRFLSSIANPSFGLRPELLDYKFFESPDVFSYPRFIQAVVLQFTCFGAPLIYYGNEVGMTGYGDPFNRAPMWWDDRQGLSQTSQGIFGFYQKCIALRKQLEPLRRGNFEILPLDSLEGVFGYTRKIGQDVIYVIFNRSNRTHRVHLQMPPHVDRVIDYLEMQQMFYQHESDAFQLTHPDAGYSVTNDTLSLTLQPWQAMVLRDKERVVSSVR